MFYKRKRVAKNEGRRKEEVEAIFYVLIMPKIYRYQTYLRMTSIIPDNYPFTHS